MEQTGIFYGSDTGNTKGVAIEIKRILNGKGHELHDVATCTAAAFVPYKKLILGIPTWHDGQLQGNWERFFTAFSAIDFSGKKVAIFGLGDQVGYPEYFIDGVGMLAQVVYENGGELLGAWPTEGYDFEASKAVFEDGWFLGLALDEDNQPELTLERITQWLAELEEDGFFDE